MTALGIHQQPLNCLQQTIDPSLILHHICSIPTNGFEIQRYLLPSTVRSQWNKHGMGTWPSGSSSRTVCSTIEKTNRMINNERIYPGTRSCVCTYFVVTLPGRFPPKDYIIGSH